MGLMSEYPTVHVRELETMGKLRYVHGRPYGRERVSLYEVVVTFSDKDKAQELCSRIANEIAKG